MRAAEQVKGEALAALRRVEAARTAELETARRRLADAEKQAADMRAQADEGTLRMEEAEAAAAGPKAALAGAVEEEKAAVIAREAARAELDRLEGARQASAERAAAAATRAAGLRGRLDAATARQAEDEGARDRQGRPEGRRSTAGGGLEVEAGFRVAVEAALGEAMRGYVVGRDAVAGLEGQRGVLVLDAAVPAEGSRRGARVNGGDHITRPAKPRLPRRSHAAAAGCWRRYGWILAARASRLLARSVWVPDMAAALAVQPTLPGGWIVATRDGGVVTSFGVVTVGGRSRCWSAEPRSIVCARVGSRRLGKRPGRRRGDRGCPPRRRSEGRPGRRAGRGAHGRGEPPRGGRG